MRSRDAADAISLALFLFRLYETNRPASEGKDRCDREAGINPHYGVVALARLFKIEHAIKRRHLAQIRFVTGGMLHTFVAESVFRLGVAPLAGSTYETPGSRTSMRQRP